jgi:predicted metal-dependent enzyme (double-stranded beta helix superfamily)
MITYEKLLDDLDQRMHEYINDLTTVGRKDALPEIKNLLAQLTQKTYGLPGELYIQEKIDDVMDQCLYLTSSKRMTHSEEQHKAWLCRAITSTRKAFKMSENEL